MQGLDTHLSPLQVLKSPARGVVPGGLNVNLPNKMGNIAVAPLWGISSQARPLVRPRSRLS
jgi:hypothetical protein